MGDEFLGRVQDITNDAWVCLDALENYGFYLSHWYSEFNGFSNVMMSFFNGLLNNIISYTNIIQDIQIVEKAGDDVGLNF
jgi:hypothetical protein